MSEVRRVIGALEDFTEDLIRQVTLEVTSELIQDTPVDTGWARANWVPSIGVDFTGNSLSIDPSPADVSSAAALQQSGQAAVLGYRIELGAVFISNNVPYIQSLNDGSSVKAPRMFVEAAIDRVIRTVTSRVRSP